MIKLFRYENYRVTISEEALALKPFRVVWERDKSQNKERAIQELGYIYFFCDPRSDYQYLTDSDERHAAIKEGEGLPARWKVDEQLSAAMKFYESFKPTASLLLEDTRFAVDKLRKLLRDIDLNAVDRSGKPIYTLSNITATIKQVPSLVKDLDEAERALNKEINDIGRVRGGGEKTVFEDSLDV